VESVVVLRTGVPAAALHWVGDDLVDLVRGRRWSSDGTERVIGTDRGARFDRAAVSPTGRYRVLYAERGTSALLLHGDKVVRELARDEYHAEDFDHPLTMGRLPDGREFLAHCPAGYDTLDIVDLVSGAPLTSGPRTPKDVFHSRLTVSPDGRHLASAGWVWHPYGIVEVFDLRDAIADPATLDGSGLLPTSPGDDAEIAAAVWLDADRLAVATTEEQLDTDPRGLPPGALAVWSVSRAGWISSVRPGGGMGTLLPAGDRVVALSGHPRLIDVHTGRLLADWPQVRVTAKDGSYGVDGIATPVAAVHPDGTRLAVAQPDHIAILRLDSA
jgi:hypothetical protein